MDNKSYSIDLSGVGSNSGGKFEDINVSGVYNIRVDIVCNKVKVSGVIKSSKDIYSKELDVSGVIKCSGSMEAIEMKVSGFVSIGKYIKSQHIFGEGAIHAKEGIESEKIDVYGNIKCDGLVNCEEFIMILEGESKIGKIGATNININGRDNNKGLFNVFIPKKFKNNRAYIKVIEGDNIEISYCDVDTIRGKNIIIGESCNIKNIEYSENIEISDLSKVDNVNKI